MNEKALTFLKLIEESLCCPICKEPFKIPVIIVSCSHNFCSICIRRYFAIKQECPICGIDASQGNLSPNRIIDGLIQRFDELRDILEKQQIQEKELTNPEKSPLLYREENPSELSTGSPQSLSTEQHPCHNSIKSTISRTTSSQTCTAETPCCSKINPDTISNSEVVENTPEFSLGLQEFYTQSQGFSLEVPCNVSGTSNELFHSELASKTIGESTSPIACAQQSLKPENTPVLIPNSETDKDNKADCPVCGLPVTCHKMNAHLDNCLAREEKKKALRQNTPKRQKQNNPTITKIAYNLLSLKELRKKMKEIGLSTSGNKEELVRRHKEFLAKYFAEQDKLKPRRLTFVLQELEREETEKKFQNTRATRNARKRTLLCHDSTNDRRKMDEMEYLKKHAKQYKELEEIVRKTFPAKRDKGKAKGSCLKDTTELPFHDETSKEILAPNSSILQLSNDVHAPPVLTEPGSPELYVGCTPSECDLEVPQNNPSGNLNAALQEDSQAEEIRKFIDASLI